MGFQNTFLPSNDLSYVFNPMHVFYQNLPDNNFQLCYQNRDLVAHQAHNIYEALSYH